MYAYHQYITILDLLNVIMTWKNTRALNQKGANEYRRARLFMVFIALGHHNQYHLCIYLSNPFINLLYTAYYSGTNNHPVFFAMSFLKNLSFRQRKVHFHFFIFIKFMGDLPSRFDGNSLMCQIKRKDKVCSICVYYFSGISCNDV